MTKENMIEVVKSIKQPVKDKKLIFQLAKELGLDFRPTNCGKCLRDYLNIIKEELGMINNAADNSDFNTVDEGNFEWIYTRKKAQTWNGYLINQDTDPEIIKKFVKSFPNGYFIKVETKVQEPVAEETKEETTIPQQEEI